MSELAAKAREINSMIDGRLLDYEPDERFPGLNAAVRKFSMVPIDAYVAARLKDGLANDLHEASRVIHERAMDAGITIDEFAAFIDESREIGDLLETLTDEILSTVNQRIEEIDTALGLNHPKSPSHPPPF